MINLLVLDLSHFDLPVDFVKIKAAGIVGVIYKATQASSYEDPSYRISRQAAQEADLLWGSYHFGTNDDVDQQVSNYLNFAMPLPNELICLDFEDNEDSTMSLSEAQLWVTRVEEALNRPNECVLYSGNLIKESITGTSGFWKLRRLWLAQYSDVPVVPPTWQDYWLWQYTDGTYGPEPHIVDGCSGPVDCNSYNGSPEQLASEWAAGVTL